MPPAAQSKVKFDRNGVASVDASDLLRSAKVRDQFAAARQIVEAQKERDRKRRLRSRKFVGSKR